MRSYLVQMYYFSGTITQLLIAICTNFIRYMDFIEEADRIRIYMYIGVDSLCRDGADTPINAYPELLNAVVTSLFKHTT